MVNIGDLPDALDQRSLALEFAPGGQSAGLGRVARAKRLSTAFFFQPNYDALIECIAPPGQAKYPPVLSGEYRDLKYRQTRLMETAKAATV